MAKISARGAVKLAEAYVDRKTGDDSFLGDTVRTYYVLRSDGKVLRTSSFPNASTAYDRKRGSYTTFGSLKAETIKEGREAMLLAFDRFTASKGAANLTIF